MKTAVAILFSLLVITPRAALASTTGYVYVADRGIGCSACTAPEILVFDGGTTRLVTRIPLAKDSTPAGIAISADGAHVYVSTTKPGGSSLVVIDGRRHVVLATYVLGFLPGQIAVRGDDSAVFIRSQDLLYRFDTASHAVTASAAVGVGLAVAFSGTTDTVLVGVYGTGATGAVTVHDPVSVTQIRSVPVATGVIALNPSRTGTRIYVLRERPGAGQPAALTTLDATTFGATDDRGLAVDAGLGAPVHAPARAAVYTAGRSVFEVPEEGSGFTKIPLPVTSMATAITIPPGQKYAFVTDAAQDANGVTAVAAIDLDTRQIVSSYPLQTPPGVDLMASTPDGARSCTYQLDSAYASIGDPREGVPIRLTTDCAWMASAGASWVHLDTTVGTSSATITISVDPNTSGATRRTTATIAGQVVTVTEAGPDGAPAFGVIDTPADGAAGLSGSLAITGWALDDVGVNAIFIYRDPLPGESNTAIPLGTATFVEGARPDVQAAYPTFPFASRAGWGYMLLTNMLPGGGNGTYRIHVYAGDIDRHSTFLGSRTIQVSNTGATKPFGALDTPGQGQSISGVVTNWGWALTPQTARIPEDGSTIDVVLDGAVVGHPVYGLDRADIAGLFPGYANTHSAVGYFTIDTTTLTNGVHTIAWVVRDSAGGAAGIGSRYFTVFNP